MRFLIVALSLLASSAALACPVGSRQVFTRQSDGAEFVPERYGERENRMPMWYVYGGRYKGRTMYLATGTMTGTSGLGTSGNKPPVRIAQWRKADPIEEGRVVANIYEGPLEGVWKALCKPASAARG